MCLSWIAVTLGDFDMARSEAEAALAEPREGVPPSIIVRAMNALSGVAFYRGKIDEALALQTECLERSRTTGDKPGIARALSNMGSFLRLSERKDEAEAMLIEGLGLCRELGDRMGEAVVLGTLGGLNYARGDRKTCGGFLLESLRIARGTENQMLVISNLSDLGEISIALGDEVAARLYCGEGLSLASELHILPYILALLVHTAGLFELQGRGERSAELVGLVEKHPALHAETRQTEIVPLLGRLRERLGAKALEAAMERGRAVELDKVVAELLGAELSGSFTEKREHEEGP
jgi:tetratricopeptide (TPR) repeat protein